MQAKRVKLNTVVYTAFIKACGTSPGLVDAAHAAFKKMIWGPRRMKPNQVTFITTMRVLREASRLHQALDVYMGMRRAGQPLFYEHNLYRVGKLARLQVLCTVCFCLYCACAVCVFPGINY